jgi:3-oxoacyl-[acyl-carrier protein] reductase
MMNEKDRVALVTGAARGIGLAIATALAGAGYRVVMVDMDPEIESAAHKLRLGGGQARAVCLDVTDEAAVQGLPGQMQEWWPKLTVLVNNAGISPKYRGKKREVIDMPLEEWNRVLAVNLTGTFLMTKACLPALKLQGCGRIVMVTSQAARTRTPVPGAHYSATKSGMTGFARVLAGEVARFGVTVNCVAPGRIESQMTAVVGDDVNAQLAASIPAGRMGRAEEVAAAVVFFASEGASYSTGAILDVNGGSFMP